jgi:hypothetical protein
MQSFLYRSRSKWPTLEIWTLGYTRDRQVEDRRVTVREAAILLGVSEGAIRKRVDRGTLEHDKGEGGRVYVYLPNGVDNGVDVSTTHESNTLISEMRSRIDFLEEELRRKDAILLNMTEVMKALNPPQEPVPEPRESPVPASEDRGDGEGREEPEKRSWWQKLFGTH